MALVSWGSAAGGLGLPAVSVWWCHEAAGDLVGDGGAVVVVVAHDLQAHVQTGCAAGRGPHPVVNVEHLGVDADTGIACRELPSVYPVLAPTKHWPAARSSAPGGLDRPRPAGPVVRGSAHRDRDIDRGEHPPVRTTTGTRRLVRAPRTHQLSASAQPMITIRWATSAELLDRRDQPRPATSTRVSGARGFPLTSSGVTGTARSVDRITDVETRNTPE